MPNSGQSPFKLHRMFRGVVGIGAFGLLAGLTFGIAAMIGTAPLAADTKGRALLPEATKTSARLFNGWTLNPAGVSATIEDFPTLTAVSPDGKWLLVGTTGYHAHTIRAFEIGPSPVRSSGPDSRFPNEAAHAVTLSHAFRGLKFGRLAHANQVFVSGGPRGHVWRLEFAPDGLGLRVLDTIALPKDGPRFPFVGGLEVLPNGHLLVVDEGGDKGSGKADVLYELDPADGRILHQTSLTLDAGPVVATPDGMKIYVADHGTGKLLVRDGHDLSPLAEIVVGTQPNALLSDGRGRIFVANTGSDTVSVIDSAKDEVVETIRTSLTPRAPLGSIPNALALSPDGERLYVSNGGNNTVAVVELAEKGESAGEEEGEASSKVLGFVPTGWYPVSVAVGPKNDWLFVGVGKGMRSRPNGAATGAGLAVRQNQPVGQAYGKNRDQNLVHDYVLSTLSGALTRVPVPTSDELRTFTETALVSSPYRDANLVRAPNRPGNSVLPDDHRKASPFKHVLYIIKENRTYDQVLGDLPKGNGDPNLVLFPRDVTPNHHRLAEEFVLLDNTYCDGEVSQDGWEWSTAALDSDWDIKATVHSYSGRGAVPGSRETIRPANDYIWEAARKRGLTIYSYGAKTFGGLFSPTWKGAFSERWNQGRANDVPDWKKADIFIEDLKTAEKTGQWPSLTLMSLTDDHTSGTRPGAPTPYASVASNDLALGKVVDAVTHSKFWPETAIFVIEDDAQNGPDHVDAHRTVAFVISPYTKRGSLDSTLYSSSSLVRSIGLSLGIPPLSQYDAAANAMFHCFTGRKNLAPFKHSIPKVDLDAKNARNAPLAALSETLDWSDVDLADFGTLNRILWTALRPNDAYPAPRTSYRPQGPLTDGAGAVKARVRGNERRAP